MCTDVELEHCDYSHKPVQERRFPHSSPTIPLKITRDLSYHQVYSICLQQFNVEVIFLIFVELRCIRPYVDFNQLIPPPVVGEIGSEIRYLPPVQGFIQALFGEGNSPKFRILPKI